MPEFIYFSSKARTSGNFQDLMKAGRLDIACHVLIASLFISHDLRKDTKLHLIFNGPPDPPKHLEFAYNPEMPISKKDVAGLIKRMLYKCKPGKKTEVFPGCFIEKKSFLKVAGELEQEGKQLYILDRKGRDIRQTDLNKDAVFIIGDHEGLPKKELKRLKEKAIKVSLGNKTYFASHAVVIVQNELDRMPENHEC